MSIELRGERCVGCGACAQICPGSLIRMRRGTAHMESPERCWGCAACVKACPTEAIALFLGEDMGGLGGRMTVRTQSACLYWRVRLPGGGETIIVTDSRDANKY